MARISKQHGGLSLEQDLVFQGRMWRIERTGWAAMALVLVGASLGFFGDGPFSEVTVERPALRVEYERFGRYHSSLDLRLYPTLDTLKDGTVSIWLPKEYLRHVNLLGIVPQPVITVLAQGGIRYIFSADEGRSAGMIVFHLQGMRVGPLAGSVVLNDESPIAFHQFIYP